MNTFNNRNKQRGAVLLIALVMLLVLTLLATTSVRETTLQAKISANLAEQKGAINAAESGLRRGERIVASNLTINEGAAACEGSATSCILNKAEGAEFFAYYADVINDTPPWWRDNNLSVDYTTDGGAKPFGSSVRWNAAYYGYDPANEVTNAEEKAYGMGPHYYVVSSKATAGGERFPVILQTVTVRRY